VDTWEGSKVGVLLRAENMGDTLEWAEKSTRQPMVPLPPDPPPSAEMTVEEEKSADQNTPAPVIDLLPLARTSYQTLIAKDIYKRGSPKECYELATECSTEALAHPIATILAGRSLTDTSARVVIDIGASDDCLFVAEDTIGQDPSPIFTEHSPHILAPRCTDSAVKMSLSSHFPELCAAFRLIHRQITGPIDQRTLEEWVVSIAPRFDSPEPFHSQISVLKSLKMLLGLESST
jgi:hypothetical protein